MESPISTKAALLASLAVESGYGSEMMDRAVTTTGNKLMLHSGSVYPALVALEYDGLIKKRKASTSGISPRACFYELTRKGRLVVEEHRQIVSAIFFPPDVRAELIVAWQGRSVTVPGTPS